MRLKFKPWAHPYLLAHQEIALTKDDFSSPRFQELFKKDNLMLEIGAGKGDFVVAISEKFPQYFFVAVEKNLAAAAIMAKKIVESKRKNAVLIHADINDFIHLIPDGVIKNIFLNFSDPWPKVRHQKRRLTTKKMIGEYARLLPLQGEVRLKTDNIELFNFSLENFRTHHWKIKYFTYTYNGHDPQDALTEYERNFREEGIPICRLIAKKGSKTYVTNPSST
ncbi:MAG: tRNA (guanosine(46)-N7)-methyltransferase TrmB [Bacilli bacterium]|jgi:tRNA (guanine-N7-)-methyltransferase